MALINLRNALMAGKRLPYDAEVEYLRNVDKTQHIDTGVVANAGTKIEVVFTPRENISDAWAMGSFDTNARMYALYQYPWAKWGGGYGNYFTGSYAMTKDQTVLATIEFTETEQTISIDGTIVSTFQKSSNFGTPTRTLYLFAHNSNSNPTPARQRILCDIGACKIWQNGILVRDFIPVRKGAVGYLYDRVTGKLFGNAGTGDFVLGPDVVPVEYIESHGTEYINLGVVPADSTGFSVDIATAKKIGRTNTRIIGAQNGNTRCLFAIYGAGEASGDDGFIGWNAVTPFRASLPARFTASVNYLNDRAAKIDGETLIDSIGTLDAMTSPMFLLNNNYDGAPFSNQYVVGRLYGAEITVGSDVANHYIPVRVGTDATSWEGAMMDVLTRRIYRNAGTGAFGYGNDLKYPIPAE